MGEVTVKRRVWLHYTTREGWGRAEVRTRDIGATIGTELLDEEGRRLVAYRPGTRYSDYAEEIAATHLRSALSQIDTSQPALRVRNFSASLQDALQAVIAAEHCRPWNPDDDSEDELW